MTTSGAREQGFDSLSNDLIIQYFWSLGLQLQEPSVEVGWYFFFSLSARQKIFSVLRSTWNP
jgi:hypothetical protein